MSGPLAPPPAAEITALTLPEWPGGAEVAVSLSFDVDGETALQPASRRAVRLSSLSERAYGVRRGLPRLLALLGDLNVQATFFVPGQTALLHRDEIETVLELEHEVGHHGHEHLSDPDLDDLQRRLELERGFEALARCGVRPTGYRSPAWELTPTTLSLLSEHGFAYDSSLMGDDRPYLIGAERQLLELPVHWSLDDVPFFWIDPERPSPPAPPTAVVETWLGEFESALAEGRHLVLTMHPEVIGRGHRASLLVLLIERMRERAEVWFAPCAAVADWVLAHQQLAGADEE